MTNTRFDSWQRRTLGWVGLTVVIGLAVSGCATSGGGSASSAGQTSESASPSALLPSQADVNEAPPTEPVPAETLPPALVPPEGQWQATLPLTPQSANSEPTSADDAIELGVSDQPTANVGGENPTSFDPVTLVLQGGTVRVLKGCTAAGQGTYIAADDGSWQFDPGSLGPNQCLAEAQAGFEAVLEQLVAADHWSYEQSSPAQAGDGFANPEFGIITLTSLNIPLRASFGYTGSGPVTWPSAPDPAPGDSSALNGTWHVESITQTAAASSPIKPKGPFTWDITIADGHITMPRGCNTGTSGAFLADSAGWWSFPVSSIRTMMACTDPERNQAEETYDALGTALTWTTDGPDALVFIASSFQVRLARTA